MEMKVIKKIENVNKFDLIMDSEIIWRDDIIELNGNIIFQDGIFNFTRFNDIILIKKNNGDICYILNLKSNTTTEIKLNGNLLNDEIILVSKWNNDFTERVVSAFNLEDNTILWQSNLGFSKKIVINDIFYIGNNTNISKHYVNTAISLWQYDLSALGTYRNLTNEEKDYEVKHFVGVYNNILIVQLSNASFIFLNIETGSVIKILHLNDILHLPAPVFYDDAYPAHIYENNLIWLSNQRLLHIDLNTLAPKVIIDYFTEPRENQFRFMSNTYHEGKIYFVSDYGWQYVTPSYVGVMNAENGEVLWYQQLEKTGGLPEAPQVSGDKLYIRTNNKVLHIFKLMN